MALDKVAGPRNWSRPILTWRPADNVDYPCLSMSSSTMHSSAEPPAAPETEKKITAATRKKRNIKALQLNVEPASAPAPAPPSMQLPSNRTKASGTLGTKPAGKRKPPPKMDLTKSKSKDGEGEGKRAPSPGFLTVDGPGSAPASGGRSASAQRTSYHSKLTEQLANLDIGSDTKLDLKLEDLEDLRELGAGNGGTVKLVKHLPTQMTMAKKASFCGF
jgi:mitogen-activated protein kinase kinase